MGWVESHKGQYTRGNLVQRRRSVEKYNLVITGKRMPWNPTGQWGNTWAGPHMITIQDGPVKLWAGHQK